MDLFVEKMRLERGKIPFIRFLLPCIIGVIISMCFAPNIILYQYLSAMVWALGIACVLCVIRIQCIAYCFFLFLLFFCWKSIWKVHPVIDPDHFANFPFEYLIVAIDDEPQDRENFIRVLGRVKGGMFADSMEILPADGYLQVYLRKNEDSAFAAITVFEYGTYLLIPANYREIPRPKNPREMDYAAHMAKNNCWHQGFVDYGGYQVLSILDTDNFRGYAFRLRQAMVSKFDQYVADRDAFAIASTLILGYRSDLSQEIMDAFSTTGTIHVLSVSGMHVMIVFWLLAKLLFWMDLNSVLRFLKFPILLVIVWAYAFLTGLSPSVLRAACMLSFVLWAGFSGKRQNIYNSIGASAFILVLFQPRLLVDIGFQLSYLAVLGIVFLYPEIQKLLSIKYALLRPVTNYSAMSIAAQAGAFPLAMYYFQQFPVYFLIANLVIVLPVTLIMYIGFAVLLIPDISESHVFLAILGKLLEKLILITNELLFVIQNFPAASLTGMYLEIWQCCLIYAILLFFSFGFMFRSGKLLLCFLLSALILWGSISVNNWKNLSQTRLIVHQVGSFMAISVVDKHRVYLISDIADRNQRNLSFSVFPYLERFTDIDKIHFVKFGSTWEDENLLIADHLIQIGGQRLLVYDGGSWLDSIGNVADLLAVDLLIVRGNPRKNLSEILEIIPAKQVVLDPSNYQGTIDRMQDETLSVPTDIYNLKNNFAYVWVMDEEDI